MNYKVTSKAVFCDVLCGGPSIFDCLRCKKGAKIECEITETYTEEQYIDLLERGNVFITKVEIE